MTTPVSLHHHAFADYLALEEASNTKHEFLAGEIYAMAGGTPEHAALAVAVSATLLDQLRARGCRVYSSDLRVRVMETGLVTYPDVSVVCGPLEHDPESSLTVVNPALVVEVLSDGTEAWDRGEKLDHYRRIPSLQAVVFVSHRETAIEVLERTGDGAWRARTFRSGEIATVDGIAVRIDVDAIYLAARGPA